MISRRATFVAFAALAASVPAHGAITISTAATQNMNCSGGTCTPTATKAVLNASDLENYLSQFGNVRVMTTGSGVEANNIVVEAAFAAPDSTSLTLEAHRAITVNAAVSVGSNVSELELQSGKGGTLGTLTFGRKGHITFGSLSDIFGINGGIFTLEGSVQGLASAVGQNPSGFYALANNYNARRDGIYRTSAITTTLNGIVEGLGNTISNFTLRAHGSLPSAFALFSVVAASGSVNDLRLTDATIRDDRIGYSMIAGIVASNSGTLTGDRFRGHVATGNKLENDYVGGVVSYNYGTIRQSSAEGSIRSGAAGDVIGGLAGYSDGIINQSRASNSVLAPYGGSAGGLVGHNYGKITQSFATGAMFANSFGGVGAYVGGLVAANAGTITNSYATGSAGDDAVDVGGFGGINGGSISASYSTGAATGSGQAEVGGFLGSNGDPLSNCYWDTTTSDDGFGVGSGTSSGLTGLTTQQLQSGLPAGFDSKVWAENPNINNGLPYLINNPPPK